MKQLVLLALTAALTVPAYAQAPQAPQPLDALDGVDTVILLQQGKETFGKSENEVIRGRFRYLFSTADTKATFEKDPARYEIQLGGLCARMGKGVRGNPSDYLVHDGRIYIFGSDECRKRFAESPAKYLEKPRPAMSTTAADIAAGRALIDRIVASHEASTKFASFTTYRERLTQVQKRPSGEASIRRDIIWRFPFDVRQERTMAMPSMPAPFTGTTVLTADAAWGMAQGRVSEPPPSALASLQLDLMRHPLALLQMARHAGTAVAKEAPATIEGTAVDRVRIARGGVDVVLAAESKSGRVHSVSFQDRSDEGEVGTYTVLYADLRPESGILVPHTMRALFNGQPDAYQTWTIEAIEVNPTVDPALFQRPQVSK
jgi:YHS domain-containing protein